MSSGLAFRYIVVAAYISSEFVALTWSTPIVGGQPVPTDDTLFDFACSLQMKEVDSETGAVSFEHFCGGALIQNHNRIGYVVTASHCVSNMNPGIISVICGVKNIRNFDGMRYSNLSVYLRKYDPYTMTGDIAILKVFFDESDSDATCITPMRFIIDENTASASTCYIYGYGSETMYGEALLELRFAPVTIIPRSVCTQRLGTYNAPEENSGLFCAVGTYPHIDACAGDSGSAMVCVHDGRLKVVGIVSYGLTCGVNGMPGAYTSVAYHFDFIRDVLTNQIEPRS